MIDNPDRTLPTELSNVAADRCYVCDSREGLAGVVIFLQRGDVATQIKVYLPICETCSRVGKDEHGDGGFAEMLSNLYIVRMSNQRLYEPQTGEVSS